MKSNLPIYSFFSVIFLLKREKAWTHAEKIDHINFTPNFSRYTPYAGHQSQVTLNKFVFAGAVKLLHILDNSVRALAISSDENDVRSIGILGGVSCEGRRNALSNAY